MCALYVFPFNIGEAGSPARRIQQKKKKNVIIQKNRRQQGTQMITFNQHKNKILNNLLIYEECYAAVVFDMKCVYYIVVGPLCEKETCVQICENKF